MRNLALVCSALLIAFLLFCGCGHEPLAGGTSTSENGMVAGIVVNSMGVPEKNVRVMLLSKQYDPEKKRVPVCLDTTDETGRFSLAQVASGEYTIQSVHADKGTGALVTGIRVAQDTVFLGSITLYKSSTVKIMLPAWADKTNGYVYVPGTTIVKMLSGSSGFVVLDSVPAGYLPSINYATIADTAFSVIRYNMTLQPGTTGIVLNPDWKYAKHLVLNTTAGGAGVAGNVRNFPLLIRLNSGSFDFSQAQVAGGDIRFTKVDNTTLPYEIERWDVVTGLAEIWVKTDTVFGNDSAQSIMLYWGNQSVVDSSNGKAVFDTGNGFIGVWHMDKNCNDATVNNHLGTNNGALDTSGAIGMAKTFHGTEFIQVPGLLGMPLSVSLSAWIQSDSISPNGNEVVSIGDAASVRMDDPTSNFGIKGCFHRTGIYFNDVPSARYVKKTGWHYIVFTIDDVSRVQSLYIDGLLSATKTFNNAIDYTGVGVNTLIGRHGNAKTGYDFIGQIDEVRISKGVLSADEIKLNYSNQRQDGGLVVGK